MQFRDKLIGEEKVLSGFEKVISENSSYIINITGDNGVGKTTLVNCLIDEITLINLNAVLITDFMELMNLDIGLVQKTIIIIDDIDEKMSKDGMISLISKKLIQYSSLKLIVTSKSKYFFDKIAGINTFIFELGNRNFDFTDFDEFILKNYTELKADQVIRENIFLLATYLKNFNYISEIIHAILMRKRDLSPIEFIDLIEKSDLYLKLKQEVVIEHNTDTKSSFIFNIRRKDPIEKLRDIIVKYYTDQGLLISVLKSVYENSSFIDELFSINNIDYEEKIIQLCFTYNPIELTSKLLGIRDIINELELRKVKTMLLSTAIEDKAKLLLKDLGLNIIDNPRGIRYYKNNVLENLRLVSDSNEMKVSREHLIGLGISCYQELESVFHEILNFYSIYFCGSASYLVELYNKVCNNHLLLERLTYGNYIQLFRFINKLSGHDNYQIALLELNRKEAIANNVIGLMESLSSQRQYFSHKNLAASSYVFLRKTLLSVYELAENLINQLIDHRIFPEIIKIKEIIFDEYGRKLFVGHDDANNEIRFSLSCNVQIIDIHMHYYVLRKSNSFAINPIIIPKSSDDNDKLFVNAEVYNKSSQTQLAQANKLIDMIDLSIADKVLDIGCGNGKTTIELYKRKTDMKIDAFDISSNMIEIAKRNLYEEYADEKCINFFTMDALDLNKENEYDMVFSNATLHWICDGQLMYTKIYHALKPGGRLAVHQGGFDSYRGLHGMVHKAIEALNYEIYYKGWKYPIFYPQKSEMERILRTIGYKNIKVESYETDGLEYPNLIENFSNAGMLPYFSVLEDEKMKKQLRNKYFELCEKEKVDLYSHRLYIFADKEGNRNA